MMKARGNLWPWADAVLNFIYPPVCQICQEHRADADEGYVCAECLGKVPLLKAPYCSKCGTPFEGAITNEFQCSNCTELELEFSFARAAVVTNPVMLEVIHKYKYARALWFEPFLSGLLARQAAPELLPGQWSMIVPVPLHPPKEREREFNQAERLAGGLAKALNIPVNKKLLRRVKPTTTQTMLTREQRTANMRNAFSYHGQENLAGEKIILVDDVLTTGATTSACAKVLRKAGAGEIGVWTVARGA